MEVDMFKKLLILTTVLASIGVYSYSEEIKSGWSFFAPQHHDYTDLHDVLEPGDIVYDSTSNKFYGKNGTGNSWVELGRDSTSGSVETLESGGVKMLTARITNSGTPTVASQDRNWISSITDTNTGDMTLNLQATAFSSTPRCFFTSESINRGGRAVAVDSDTVAVDTYAFDGNVADFDYQILCVGKQ